MAVLLERVAAEDINRELARLRERGLAELAEQGLPAAALRPQASLDLRYRGQSSTLNLEWENDIETAAARFHQLHRARYGHQLDNPVELVNARPGPESVAASVAPARHAGSEGPRGRRQQGGDASPWLRRASAIAFPRTPDGASARTLCRLRPGRHGVCRPRLGGPH